MYIALEVFFLDIGSTIERELRMKFQGCITFTNILLHERDIKIHIVFFSDTLLIFLTQWISLILYFLRSTTSIICTLFLAQFLVHSFTNKFIFEMEILCNNI